MEKTILRILFAALMMGGCSGPPAEKAGGGWPGHRLQSWLDYYGLQLEDFDQAGRFDASYPVRGPHEPADEELYAPLYVYSADSTLAIDLDSYHLVINRRNDGSLYSPGREADMEVALIDLEAGLRTRLLFCGTPCLFEEAGFHPDGRVFVAGFSEAGSSHLPAIWLVDTAERKVDFLQATRAFHPVEVRYISEVRLSHIDFLFETFLPVSPADPLP